MENGELTDKLILNTKLERKPTDLDHKACVIEKAIPVDHEKFLSLKNAPYLDERLIAQNKDCMYYDSGGEAYHCLLIYDKDQGDGIVIESEGSDYARYAQLVPQAKSIYENYRDTHLNELKLYCPLSVSLAENGNFSEIPAYRAAFYCNNIRGALKEAELPQERERGLMYWYHDGGSIDNKICSAHMDVEVSGGELVGVIRAQVMGTLSDEEMSAFIEYCTGQLSDGVGESFEQKYVRTEDGEIKVSFWSGDYDWELLHEDEFMNVQSEDMEMSM